MAIEQLVTLPAAPLEYSSFRIFPQIPEKNYAVYPPGHQTPNCPAFGLNSFGLGFLGGSPSGTQPSVSSPALPDP